MIATDHKWRCWRAVSDLDGKSSKVHLLSICTQSNKLLSTFQSVPAVCSSVYFDHQLQQSTFRLRNGRFNAVQIVGIGCFNGYCFEVGYCHKLSSMSNCGHRSTRNGMFRLFLNKFTELKFYSKRR